jgi:hypothetical protein
MRNDTIVSREVKPYLPVVKLVAREISLKIMVDNDRGVPEASIPFNTKCRMRRGSAST